MIERLDFGEMTPYNAVEASIHLNRYSIVKPVCKNKIILDAACGEGYGSFFLNKWGAKEVFGLDIDEETIKKADKIFGSSNVKFQCHDVEKLPFPDRERAYPGYTLLFSEPPAGHHHRFLF